jgi:tagatose-1,6-bisphosphate aldolase non-catalytic subunit AgaZ/GatZ
MMIQPMIRRLISLRETEGIHMTLLAVCPNSEAVLEAAVLAASRHNTPLLFAVTMNQVDRDGGYTGWTPQQFIQRMKAYAAQYQVTDGLYPCLDHGGQWLKDQHTQDRLSFEATTEEVKTSITAMLQAGYQLFHMDATLDRTSDRPPSIQEIVRRSLDLIAYTESERTRLGLPPVAYEVGSEEVHGGLVDLARLETFLKLLYRGLDERGLGQAAPSFIVAQVGTDINTSTFDRDIAYQLYRLVSPYGALIKGHYTDWVDHPEAYPQTGMGGANVGPEFTAVEYDTLVALERREQDLLKAQPQLTPSQLTQTLIQAVDESNRWRKWLRGDEIGKALVELSPERQEWLVKTCARYIWVLPQVVAARQRLYTNLSTVMDDPHHSVIEAIARAIERYITAFHLENANRYFT